MNKNSLLITLFFGFISLLSAFQSSAHAGTFIAYGPQTFIRVTGQPVTETASFNIKDPNTSYTLHIYNGGIRSELTRVSSAVIKLNGSTIFDTNDFNQQVVHLQKQVTVTKSNLLEAELRSIPDSGLTVLLEGVDNDPPIINIISPQGGSTVKTSKPDIAIEYSDVLSGVDISTAKLTVDGIDITADAAITETGITYTPPAPLKDGLHTVTASVSDKAGNTGDTSVSFTVKAKQRPFIFPEPGFDAGGSKLLEVVDVDGDGALDVLVLHNKSNFSYGSHELQSKVSVILGKGDGAFKEPIDVGETLGGASNANIVDLNEDGYPDIVICNYYWRSSSIFNTFLNNGDGTFSPGPSQNIDNQPYQGRVFAGDFNVDNHKDIAALGGDKLVIYYGKGDGSFSEPVESPLPDDVVYLDYFSDFLPLDFNNDGMTDFAATVNVYLQDGKVALLLNNGDGTFRHSTIFEEDFSWNFSSLAVSDVDKDGSLDIGVISQDNVSSLYDPASHSGFTILMGDGNGGIKEQRHYEPSPGSYYNGILAKDFNGDNAVDVLLCQGDYYSDKAVVLPGNGDGTFNDQNPLTSTAYCYKDTKTGDVDGDGIEDLISISSVLFGRGDGTFIDRKVIPSREYTSFIASADFDGDKSPDIAMSGNEYEEGALFSVIPNKGSDWSGSLFQGINRYKAGERAASVKVGDLNGDGRLDVVTSDDVFGNISVLLNIGDGKLKESGIYEVGKQPASIALEDMNRDGRLDIIVANKGSDYISILMNNGDETFQPQIKADMPCHSYYSNELFTGDFTEDGRPDIIISGCYSNNSSDTYPLTYNEDKIFSYKQLGDGKGLFAVAKGDFNEDGHLDLATNKTVLFGKGDGTFYKAFNEIYSVLLVGDVNRDGHLDLVTPQGSYLGNGSGRFMGKTQPGMYLSRHSKLADIDSDGNLDVLSAEGWNIFRIWSGRGDGTFSNDISLVHDITSFKWEQGDNPLDTGDMNGDSVPDIIYVDGVNLKIIPGTGGGGFPVETVFNDGSYRSSDSLAIADFNGDNNQDISVSKREFDKDNNPLGKTSAAVYWGTGNNTFRKGPVMETPYEWSDKITAGDFNGDGKPDIAIGGWAREGVSVFLNNGDGTFGSATSYAIKDMIKDFWVADINSDGRLDTISSDVKTVSYGNYTYSLSIHVGKGDGTFQYQHSIPLMGGVSGLVIKDFNGDGFTDLAAAVWYDSSGFSNKVEVFISNGDGTFKAPIATEAGESLYWLNSLISDDFNHDGFMDIAVKLGTTAISLLTGNGDGTFNLSAKYSSGYGYSSGNMEPGDFNLDGRLDIAVAGWEINLLLNNLPPLRTPPAPPAKLSGKAGDGTASLSWAANTEEDLVGYNVYRSLSAGGGYVKLNSTTVSSPIYTDSAAANGTTYYYTVSAVDKDGDESSYAFKVKVIPNQPDIIPPVVKINNPVNGGMVYSPKLFVLGAINETDAKVIVNGITGTIQKNDNTFTAYGIPLSVGENTITTTAVDAAGNSSTDSIKVIYVPTASISGVVKDELTGQPVQWASVYITDSEKTQSLSTGADGRYFFGKLIPGEVIIMVDSSNNYDRITLNKTISSGEALNLDIFMLLTPARLSGTVYNSYNYRGIPGATVTVTDRKKIQSVSTYNWGGYEVTDIAPYDVTITVSKPGYETYTETRTLQNRYTNWRYYYLKPLPPSAPSGLIAAPGCGYITLTWDQSLEDLDGYNIYRSTTPGSGYVKLNSWPIESTSYKDIDVVIGTTYYYVITAANTSQMESGYSTEASAVPRNVYAPTGLTATAGEGFVDMNWSPSADSDVSSYKIYRSTESGTGYSYITTTSGTYYKDKSVTGGTTYYYVATAVNTISKESPYSNKASATPEELKLSVSITYPKDGEWLKNSRIIVRGTVETASNEAGVVIETGDTKSGASARYLAEVNGQEFAAVVNLPEGFSYIKAIATDGTGNKAETSVMVSAMPSPETVKLTATPESGIMTLKTITSPLPTRGGFPMPEVQTYVMDITLEAETYLPDSITSYSWDTNGDGWSEQVGTMPEITASYYSAGLYFPTVTVTDSKGNTYTATTIVNVLSKDQIDTLLKGKWEGMKAKLISGDIDGALQFIADASQDQYKDGFEALKDQLPVILSLPEELRLNYIIEGIASYDAVISESDGMYSYPMRFIRDENGIWKIMSF